MLLVVMCVAVGKLNYPFVFAFSYLSDGNNQISQSLPIREEIVEANEGKVL